MKKIPLRRDLTSGEMLPKEELLRIVLTPSGEILIDESGKMNGRGAYLKRDYQALPIIKKKRLLDKALKCSISDEFYLMIEEYLKKEVK